MRTAAAYQTPSRLCNFSLFKLIVQTACTKGIINVQIYLGNRYFQIGMDLELIFQILRNAANVYSHEVNLVKIVWTRKLRYLEAVKSGIFDDEKIYSWHQEKNCFEEKLRCNH